MKKEDFIGKWFLRGGDMKPCQIEYNIIGLYAVKILETLYKDGFIFDTEKDAMLRYKCIMGALKHDKEPKEIVLKQKDIKKRIYISGPISGHDKGDSEARFQRAEYELISKGYEVFNPMKNGLPFEASTSQHMRRDLNELTREDKPYDAIYLMKKWNHSAGCWTEFKVALAMGLEVLAEQDDVVYRFV